MSERELNANSITITYLSKVTFASLNGADKDIDNINPIKKITLDDGKELPYISSQAIRRALRNSLIDAMGFDKSGVQQASADKGAPKTQMNPAKYIEDDLFGYMDASPGKDGGPGKSKIRTSPIRVESLVAISDYKGDLDYATNFMGNNGGANPNIFETEIHSGIYRGTILIELDRIGRGQGFDDKDIDNKRSKKRVLAFLDAFRNLWSSGRQTRFLADISPKFVTAAFMKVKNPIFLEALNVVDKGKVNITQLKTVTEDYKKFIKDHVFASQAAIFETDENVNSLDKGFSTIEGWIIDYYE